MYPHQAERLTSVLEREGLEALIASAPENIAYVTGFRSLSQAIYRRTPLFAVFARSGTALVVPVIDVAAVAAASVDAGHVLAYGEFFFDYHEAPGDLGRRVRDWTASPSPSAADALARALETLGVRRGPVGLDDGHLAFDAWHRAGERLAPMKVIAAGTHFAESRMVKSPYELETVERALHAAEEAANQVVQALAPGMTEREAVALYERALRERDASAYVTIIAFGDRSAIPAPYPSDRALKPGDLVRLELGAALRGYCAHVARTAVAGAATARHESLHRSIQMGVEAAIDAIKPGVRADRVFDAAVAATREHGLPDYRRHHVGHGIGLEPYEPPVFAAGDDTELEPGMVVRVEAPYYLIGWGGMNLMETVLVIRGGGRVMNRSARGLVVLD
ncbi:MAG: aminopeptidase P family protein [Candidatus Rokubacteria bacterium]|nr:aminopeptidase P family protein [Candidatus Rokubacteria bacterium]